MRTKLNFKDRVNKEEFIQYYQELKSARRVAKIYNVDKGTILSYELLYKDSSYLRLERKYNKFNDFLIKLDEFKKCRP